MGGTIRSCARRVAAAIGLAAAAVAPLAAQDLAIRRWLVRGPIAADTGAAGVTRDYLDGEAGIRPDSGDTVAGGAWIVADADSNGAMNLNRVLSDPRDWTVAYGLAYVLATREQTAYLVMDSDDDLVAYLNGQRVWVHVVPRGVGTGSDTVTVRLAAGWNTLLLKARNRTGGFGLLGRLAPVTGEGPLEGMRTAVRRPAELARGFLTPAAGVIVSPVQLDGGLTWNGGALEARVRLTLSAWGPASLQRVAAEFRQGPSTWRGDSVGTLAPGQATQVVFTPTFDELRGGAIGSTPLQARLTWSGGERTSDVGVSPDLLLRALGGRLALGSWLVDSAGSGRSLRTRLMVPAALAGLTVDLLAAEYGPRAVFTVGSRTATMDRGRVPLCAPCRAGDTLDLVIRLDPAQSWWSFPVARVRDTGYREYADGYDYARAFTGRIPAILRPDPREWLFVLGDTAALRPLMDRHAAAYAPLAAEIRRDTLHLVGNSHIDAAWLWPWGETIGVIRDTWRSSLRIGSAHPGYVFAASAAAFFDAMDRLEPALADSLARAVAEGTFALVGGWWVEPDQNLPTGESLARQGLYGQRYFQRRFGRQARVAWTPDSFGYPWTLPQIYAQSGFTAFVTQKIRWNDSTQLPYNAFWWEGRDGTRLFTYNPYGYDHDLAPAALVEQRLEDRTRPGSTHHQMVLYGVGDHGGGPTMAMLQRAEDLARVPTFPVMRYANPDSALTAIRRGAAPDHFPVWRDELYLEYHRGTFTTQAWMKARNRRSEGLLRTAEALAAVDTARYPRELLEAAWRRVLFNQFHDILPGSSIRQVYLDAIATYDTAWALLDTLRSASFAGLAARFDTRAPRRTRIPVSTTSATIWVRPPWRGVVPVVVFNPLSWTRSAMVEVHEPGLDAAFWAPDVPALGARVFWLEATGRRRAIGADGRPLAAASSAARAGTGWLENDFLRVEVDTVRGTITRLYDKRRRREVLAAGGRGNVLEFFGDRPRSWDAWDIGYTGERGEPDSATISVVAQGGGSAELLVTRRWGRSTVAQRLVLTREQRHLDVRTRVDWHEDRTLLKIGFVLAVAPDSLTCEIPFGTIGRTGRPRTQAERAKYEFPCQRWVDASDSSGGAAFFTDSKYGWDWQGNVLRLSALRSPRWPDSLADRGVQEFAFAVYPHAGDWRAAAVDRRAAEYNVPLAVRVEPPHAGPLGRSAGFASVDAPNVEIAWVKRAEDTDALVLRLVEWHGRPATATVTLHGTVRRARRANLLEEPGDALPSTPTTVRVALRPYEIATVIVDMDR
jgi:alpha-mannosidase